MLSVSASTLGSACVFSLYTFIYVFYYVIQIKCSRICSSDLVASIKHAIAATANLAKGLKKRPVKKVKCKFDALLIVFHRQIVAFNFSNSPVVSIIASGLFK